MKLGTVKTIIGNAYVVNDAGVQRNLKTGDDVYQFDLLTTDNLSAVELNLLDGSSVTLGRNTQILLNDDFAEQVVANLPSTNPEVRAIQEQILDGQDPTIEQPAPAAGDIEQDSNEGVDFIQVDYLAPQVIPEAGFDTTGVNFAFEENIEEEGTFLTEAEIPGFGSLIGDGSGGDGSGGDGSYGDGPITELTTVRFDEDNLVASITSSDADFLNLKARFDASTSFVESVAADATGIDDVAVGDDLPVGSATSISGSLTIDFGSAGAAGVNFVDSSQQPTDISSGGELLQFWVSDDGQSLVGFIVKNDSGYDIAEIILTAELTSNTGDFKVTLLGALDHINPDFEDNLLVNLAIVAEDNQGQTDFGTLQIDIDDDRAAVSTSSLNNFIYELSISYLGGDAGYKNSFGYYIKDENGEPIDGEIIWNNVKQQTNSTIEIEGYLPEQIGFFIIPNGGHLNKNITDGSSVTFSQIGNGEWRAFVDGKPLSGARTKVIFDNADLNKDSLQHVVDNNEPGNQNWEDIVGGGDSDFNDLNIETSWSIKSALGDLSIDFGADETGSVELTEQVSIFDGLGNQIDSLYSNGKAITFETGDINNDGVIDLIGSTEDGEVLSIKALLDTQQYELNVLGPIDNSDADITIQANGMIKDGDGDVTDFNLDINLSTLLEQPSYTDIV